jgi:hypothetical protein
MIVIVDLLRMDVHNDHHATLLTSACEQNAEAMTEIVSLTRYLGGIIP